MVCVIWTDETHIKLKLQLHFKTKNAIQYHKLKTRHNVTIVLPNNRGVRTKLHKLSIYAVLSRYIIEFVENPIFHVIQFSELHWVSYFSILPD
jgi:hypothetical protein